MLYVMIKLPSTAMVERQWHTGEVFPVAAEDILLVTEVQADGEELMVVLTELKGLPTSKAPVQHWFDSDAKFIASYLRNRKPLLYATLEVDQPGATQQ